jgi:cysteinyl-tRNA synthetase
VNIANKNIDDLGFISSARTALKEFLIILGITLQGKKETKISDKEIKAKIAERLEARKNKDFALSDKIRKELEQKGVILEDTKEGTTWRRKI